LLQERDQPKPWAPSDALDTFINAMVRGILHGSGWA
jgi:hypothetical protein